MSIERGGKHVYINGHTGSKTEPFDKRNEIANLGVGPAAYLGNHVLMWCPVCFSPMTHNGSSIDHIVSKSQLIADLAWSAETANQKVGHESNLLQACSGCNSSKQNSDLFAWWRSEKARSYLLPDDRERAIQLLDELKNRYGKERVTHLPFGDYKTVVLQIQHQVLARKATS